MDFIVQAVITVAFISLVIIGFKLLGKIIKKIESLIGKPKTTDMWGIPKNEKSKESK